MARKRPRKPSPPLPPPHESSWLYARIAPRHIAMFRFLLEAQDNLGYMTVLDRGVGGGTNDNTAEDNGAARNRCGTEGGAPGGTGKGSTAPGADAVLKIVFSPHQEREMRAFLEGMRATIPFTVFESPLRARATSAG
ncbi:DUF4911 domain-containing protein [Nitratidesulfovibrio sp. SRB-5]|uniref:DUF4911 domain-containing protein n=1 Tax=Nitratidesulfovibrio sp. SRB-5 TaxID=2872636 RepID=UPI00102573BC|nr:DUF4911 domain-containing protein [Nitratidesulfovibrio sp. SRB-5]MBZ2173463.1 DUF4911 domain-containing protein [Nitratidesulfovibrio sp. SRB-5]RXF75221.1 DUF4911 domain-containing protein [Desulfovibrio sp. DS-1]